MAGLEPGAVTVEAQEVGAPGAAGEPTVEAQDEPGVGDAQVGPSTLGWIPASEGGTDSANTIGHAKGSYVRRPTRDLLLRRALDEVGTGVRSECGAAFLLARQLQANGYSHAEGVGPLLDFAASVSPSFTSNDALRNLRGAYRKAPLAPWGSAGAER